MVRLFLGLPAIILVILSYVALASAADPCPRAPNGHVLCQPAMLKWLSYRTMFNLFIKKYRHEISFAHTTHYRVTMEYESRGFNTHCHEDGQFCVTHGDPMSPEMATWYKGYNYQHNTVTSNCEDTEFCAVYMDIIGSK